MHVEWYGQSSFRLTDGSTMVFVDPFGDMAPHARPRQALGLPGDRRRRGRPVAGHPRAPRSQRHRGRGWRPGDAALDRRTPELSDRRGPGHRLRARRGGRHRAWRQHASPSTSSPSARAAPSVCPRPRSTSSHCPWATPHWSSCPRRPDGVLRLSWWRRVESFLIAAGPRLLVWEGVLGHDELRRRIRGDHVVAERGTRCRGCASGVGGGEPAAVSAGAQRAGSCASPSAHLVGAPRRTKGERQCGSRARAPPRRWSSRRW